MFADGSRITSNTTVMKKEVAFEPANYWNEGRPLETNQEWPECCRNGMIRVRLSPLCQVVPLPGASPFCNPCCVRLQAVDASSSQFYNDIRLVEA